MKTFTQWLIDFKGYTMEQVENNKPVLQEQYQEEYNHYWEEHNQENIFNIEIGEWE